MMRDARVHVPGPIFSRLQWRSFRTGERESAFVFDTSNAQRNRALRDLCTPLRYPDISLEKGSADRTDIELRRRGAGSGHSDRKARFSAREGLARVIA